MHEGCAQIVVAPVGGVAVVTVLMVVMSMIVFVVMVMIMIIMLMIIMPMIMPMAVVMMVIVTQQEGAHQVDGETQECNRNGLAEGNVDR